MDDVNEAILLAGYIAAGLCPDDTNFFEKAAQQQLEELQATNTHYNLDWPKLLEQAHAQIEYQITSKKLKIEKEFAKHRAGKAMANMAQKLFTPPK